MLTILAGIAMVALGVITGERGTMVVEVTFLGPVACLVGLAKLIHGDDVELGRMTPLLRRYAVVGSLAGVGVVWWVGLLRHPHPFDGVLVLALLSVIWFARRGTRPLEAKSQRPSR